MWCVVFEIIILILNFVVVEMIGLGNEPFLVPFLYFPPKTSVRVLELVQYGIVRYGTTPVNMTWYGCIDQTNNLGM